MAYLSSLVDNVPFSFRSKHLKASRYSVGRNEDQAKTSVTVDENISAEKNKQTCGIGSMQPEEQALVSGLPRYTSSGAKRKSKINPS